MTLLVAAVDGHPSTRTALGARDLDALIRLLGEARSMLHEPVPPELDKTAVARELMVLDPAWRTEGPVHAALNGVTLRLRHPGFGWLTFLLPWNEAKSLGEWLTKNSTHGAP